VKLSIGRLWLVFWVAFIVPAAGEPMPVTLGPVEHEPAEVVIETPDGTQTTYTPAQLEEFPTYTLTTTTPWRSEPARFEGPLLVDVLRAHGLDQLPAIMITAENDFMVEMESEVWNVTHVLMATRVNGKPLTRRERGPVLLVIDAADYEREAAIGERHLVWMVSRIHGP